jgi:TPR repeat protein
MTDIELSRLFHDSISSDYVTALDFLTVNPDHSLVLFRNVLAALCIDIAEKKQLSFKSTTLNHHINHLYEKNIINEEFKNNLHDARKHTNAGAHKHSILPNDGTYTNAKQILIDKAKVVRTLIIKILEDAYLIINNDHSLPEIEQTSINTQRYKEILFEAATSVDDKLKLQAGIIYESMADDFKFEHTAKLVPSTYQYHLDSLHKLAADHYEASYKMSLNIDAYRQKLPLVEANISTEEIIHRYCKLEPLYKYAILATEGLLGDYQKDNGLTLMRIAADRGYGTAQAYLGAYLYREKNEYDLAKTYLDMAAEKDEPLAYRFLFYFYGEELACKKDKTFALNYLNSGIELDCEDCLAELGIAYHKGLLIEQNNDKAEEILQRASDAGSLMAHQYLKVEFNDLRGQFIAKAQELLQHMNNLASISTNRQKKIGANEICPCGSGKKYKKCCRNKSSELVQNTLFH